MRRQHWVVPSCRVIGGFVGMGALGLFMIPACSFDETPIVTCVTPPETSSSQIPCIGDSRSDDVCISGGEFTMGHCALPYTPPSCAPWETCGPGNPPATDYSPPHRVQLSPFFIDRYPATNGQYKECYDAGECPPTCSQEQSCGGGHFSDNDMTDPQLADYPVSTLTVQGAEAYCRWKGKRLPTEAEWERAARGPKSFDYPWGNEAPDCSRYICNPTDVPSGWLRFYFPKVGANPGDVSPEGVHDMITSANQIMYDYYDPGYYKDSPFENPPGASVAAGFRRVVRGNPWLMGGMSAPLPYNGVDWPTPAWVRGTEWPGGVRCARSDDGVPPPSRPDAGPTLMHGVFPQVIQLDATHIYFVDGERNAIDSALHDGSELKELATGLPRVTDLQIDGDYIYAALWGTRNAAKEYLHDGAIVRIPKSGGAVENLVTALEAPEAIALENGWIYWANGGTPTYASNSMKVPGSIMRIPTTGGTTETLASNQLGPNSLVLVDGFVHWANWGTEFGANGPPNGGIYRVPNTGGPVEIVADKQDAPSYLVHGTELMWIVHRDSEHGTLGTFRNGQVMQLGSEQYLPGAITPFNGMIFWRAYQSILVLDGQTGATNKTLPNAACGAEWSPFWVGVEGIFWGCEPFDDIPGTGTMRFMKPW